MNITIYGAGYVGLVSGICFAVLGHNVCCMDIDDKKVAELKQGRLPIYEENLEALLKENLKAGRLQFTTDFSEAVTHAVLQMIAVGTPSKEDGAADLQYVNAVAKQIGAHMTDYRCVVIKSTVPMGTAKTVSAIIAEALKTKASAIEYDIVSNPEFLREGRAVKDCMAPERIIIGVETEKAEAMMQELYAPLTAKGFPLLSMDNASAELTKYAANAFLATKVSFINEISQIAERVGANIHAIKRGIGTDSRINEKFLNAGCGFGGSCFPKDISALQMMSKALGYEPHMLNAVLHTNKQQQDLLFQKLTHYFKGELKNKAVALWGLAFKSNTDDVRSATSRVLIDQLLDAGAIVQAYDPLAMDNIRKHYRNEPHLILCDDKMTALHNADALVIVTEWNEFKTPVFSEIKLQLRFPVIFDGRNIYDRATVKNNGLEYFGIGC